LIDRHLCLKFANVCEAVCGIVCDKKHVVQHVFGQAELTNFKEWWMVNYAVKGEFFCKIKPTKGFVLGHLIFELDIFAANE